MDFYRLRKKAIDAYVLCFDYFFKLVSQRVVTVIESENE